MNKYTIIILTSLVTLIQISNALPIVVTAPKNNDSDNQSDHLSKDNHNDPNSDHSPKDLHISTDHGKTEPEPKPVAVLETSVESKKSHESNEPKQKTKGEVTNYYNMEEFLRDTIRSHLGDNMEFESMSDETEQQLYDMFIDMNMI